MSVVLAGCLVCACANGPTIVSPTSAVAVAPRPVFDIQRCEASAARLTAPLSLTATALEAPERLAAGRFIYRCGDTDGRGWVMFPREGERIDCLRRVGPACPHGWADRKPSVEPIG